MDISIIGGGSWGTTLAQTLCDNGNTVLVQDINEEFVNKINNEHLHPFFDVNIPTSIKATTSLSEACAFSDILILCVPTKVIRSVVHSINTLIDSPKIFVNVSKGIEPNTSLLVSQIINEEVPNKVKAYVVLSGPSHAEELIYRKFTTLVSASTDFEAAKLIQQLFSNDTFVRVYTSDDVIGVEAGGAIKNAIAFVSGVAYGLGLGENARAALITRGIREIILIVEALGGRKETAYGLSGIGDLIVTASSMNSRNFQAGLKVGQGEPLEEVLNNSKMVVEGVRTIQAAHQIGIKYNLELPIIDLSYSVLFENLNVDNGLKMLLNRKLKSE